MSETEYARQSRLSASSVDSLTRVVVMDFVTRLSLEEPEIQIRSDSAGPVVAVMARRAEMKAASVVSDSVGAVSRSDGRVATVDTLRERVSSVAVAKAGTPSASRVIVVLLLVAGLWLFGRIRRR
ncbi:MAG: hypothetical protein K2I64_00115 [Muribaculaceae bacterium]|nr:hypothetical protein [Muribaculaceae bacterium]